MRINIEAVSYDDPHELRAAAAMLETLAGLSAAYRAAEAAEESCLKLRAVEEILEAGPDPIAPTSPTAPTVPAAPTAAPGTPELPTAEEPTGAASVTGVDKTGRKWDERIDSSSKKLTAEGVWARRRNVTDEVYNTVLNELGFRLGNPAIPTPPTAPTVPAPPASTASTAESVASPPSAPTTSAAPAAVPTPPAPTATAGEPQTFNSVMRYFSGEVMAKRLAHTDMEAACQAIGIASPGVMLTDKSKCDPLLAELQRRAAANGAS